MTFRENNENAAEVISNFIDLYKIGFTLYVQHDYGSDFGWFVYSQTVLEMYVLVLLSVWEVLPNIAHYYMMDVWNLSADNSAWKAECSWCYTLTLLDRVRLAAFRGGLTAIWTDSVG